MLNQEQMNHKLNHSTKTDVTGKTINARNMNANMNNAIL